MQESHPVVNPLEPSPPEDMAKKKVVEVAMDGAKATVEVPAKPFRKCSINDLLPSSVVALVKANPHNETIRKLLLAHLKQEPPVDANTFPKIRDWVEFNFERPETAWEQQARLNRERIQREVAAQQARDAASLTLQVSAEENREGSCNYRCKTRGEGAVLIHPDEIRRLAREADSGESLMDRIESFIYDRVMDRIDMNPVPETIRLNNREIDGSSDYEATLSEASTTAIKEYLRQNMPEQYSRLFPPPPKTRKDR